MKRTLSLLLAVVFIVMLLPATFAFATWEGEPTLSLSAAVSGETVTVTVAAGAYSNLNTATFWLWYDNSKVSIERSNVSMGSFFSVYANSDFTLDNPAPGGMAIIVGGFDGAGGVISGEAGIALKADFTIIDDTATDLFFEITEISLYNNVVEDDNPIGQKKVGLFIGDITPEIEKPVKYGSQPSQVTVTCGTGYTGTATAWSGDFDAGGKFKPGKPYSTNITLQADEGFKFNADQGVSLGEGVAITNKQVSTDGSTVTLTATVTTADRVIDSIKITPETVPDQAILIGATKGYDLLGVVYTDGEVENIPLENSLVTWSVTDPVTEFITISNLGTGAGDLSIYTEAAGLDGFVLDTSDNKYKRTITVQAVYGTGASAPTATREVKITRDAAAATTVQFSKIAGEDFDPITTDMVVKPMSETKTVPYYARTLDQYGIPMTDTYSWVVVPASVETMPGVSWTGVTDGGTSATLNVGTTANPDPTLTATATATSKLNTAKAATVTITINKLNADWDHADIEFAETLEYGMKNSDIITVPLDDSTIMYNTDGTEVYEDTLYGRYTLATPDEVQDAGDKKIKVIFTANNNPLNGEYVGLVLEHEYDVNIAQKDIAECTFEDIADLTYTGSAQTPTPVIKHGDYTLVAGTDYETPVTYANNKDAKAKTETGAPQVSVTGKGNYTGTAVKKFTINKANITKIDTGAPSVHTNAYAAYVTNGWTDKAKLNTGAKAFIGQTQTVTVEFGDTTPPLTEGNIPITWADTKQDFNAKGAEYTFVGTPNLAGKNFENPRNLTLDALCNVEPVNVTAIKKTTTEDLPSTLTFNKQTVLDAEFLADLDIPASVYVTYDKTPAAQTLTAEWDQTLEQIQEVAATVTETSGDKTVTVTLQESTLPPWATRPSSILLPAIVITITNKTPVTVTVTPPTTGLTYNQTLGDPSASAPPEVTDPDWIFEYKLKTAPDTDYTEDKPKNAGTYTVRATLDSDTHSGSGTADFTIGKATPTAADFDYDLTAVDYDGTEKKVEVKLKPPRTGAGEFTVIYKNHPDVVPTNADTYSVHIFVRGGDNYKRELVVNLGDFTINKATPVAADFDFVIPEGDVYDGTAQGLTTVPTLKSPKTGIGTITVNYNDAAGAPTNAGDYAVTLDVADDGTNFLAATDVDPDLTYTIAPRDIQGSVVITAPGQIAAGTRLTAAIVNGEDVFDTEYKLADNCNFKWYRNDALVQFGNVDDYTVPSIAQTGDKIYVEYEAKGNFKGTMTSDPVVVGATPLTATGFEIEGSTGVLVYAPKAGAMINGADVVETSADYTLQWYRGEAPITGATGLTYKPVPADIDQNITLRAVGKGEYTGTVISDILSPEATRPAAPVLSVRATGTKAVATWTLPDDGGGGPTTYTVYLDGTIEVEGLAAMTYTFTSLIIGETYTAKVVAVNQCGASEDSNEVTFKPVPVIIDDPTGGGGGGGPTPFTKPVSISGSGITANTANAAAGSTVTLTVDPDKADSLTGINVTTSDGEKVAVTKVNDTTYTFTMPSTGVTVTPVYGSELPFTDVELLDWFYDAVKFCYDNGIMQGTGPTTFSPGVLMTREMVWAVLARMDGQTVGGVDWAAQALAWATANGISDGTNPTEMVTREQLVTMLYRFAKYKGLDTTQGGMAAREFSDIDSVSDWARQGVDWAINAGVLKGNNNEIMPQAFASRAENAQFFMNFITQLKVEI